MATSASGSNSTTSGRRKRVVDKEKHRLELLEATAVVIAEFGVAGTTIDRIVNQSGLSRGMINLHFKSKENLFRELLLHMAEKYTKHWNSALDEAGEGPLERISALVSSDFSPKIMNTVDSAVWTAFRAEARNQDEIRVLIDTRDTAFCRTLLSICAELAARYNPKADPNIIADAIANLLEGYLLDYHLNPNGFDPEWAKKVCMTVLRAYFGIEAR